ncbi:hypothetical protein EMIT043CA1_150068 [Pseudomonas brassicacearum]
MTLLKFEMRRWSDVASRERVIPPTGAIKDRWIGGLGGKSKPQTSNTDSGIKADRLGSECLTLHGQCLLQPTHFLEDIHWDSPIHCTAGQTCSPYWRVGCNLFLGVR